MVLYIDKSSVPDPENIPNDVFKYLLEKAKPKAQQLAGLYDIYLGRDCQGTEEKDEIHVNVNYAKYNVDLLGGFFLGEPVKYDSNEKSGEKPLFSASGAKKAVVKNGNVVEYDGRKKDEKKAVDISPVLSAYDAQVIAKVDSKIGKFMGIYGQAQELLYASDEAEPKPKSTVLHPQNCILVRDNTVEHRNIFFMTYEEREHVDHQKYYAVTVYTDKTERYYESVDLDSFMFRPAEPKEHYFGAVPCVNYDNNDDRQGDVEQIASLSKAYSNLLSDRLTDKHKFIDAILAIFGFSLPDDGDNGEKAARNLKENKMIDGIPTDARIEYIQRVFDETSVKVLSDDLVRDIHKMAMTVDMSDESFSGNITGVALEMKFMPMSFLTKTKIRNMDEGLKRRFELYNNWLCKKGVMQPVSKNDVDVIFTVDMPSNLTETVDIVQKLEGRVDEQTLLAQLPFVKDPVEMAEIMKKQKEENKKQLMDSFGKSNPLENKDEKPDEGEKPSGEA